MRSYALLTFLFTCVLAQVDFVPSGPELDLVLRQIGDFDLNLLKVEDGGSEDVIYLQRRAPPTEDLDSDGCKKDDCAKFKSWAVEGGDEKELKDSETPEDTKRDAIGARAIASFSGGFPDEPHYLSKRGKPKPAKICGNTKIDGKSTVEPAIEWESHSYPDNKAVEKFKKVYDFEEISQPNTAEWFKVKNIEKRIADRDYVVEHILEWQMYLRFLTGKKGKTNKENENSKKAGDDDDDDDASVGNGDPELCETLHKYWKDKIKFEVVQEVKKGKNWIPTTKPTSLTESPLEYVGHQYPGGSTKSPYSEEFVILEHGMNSRKEHLWTGNSISPSLAFSGDKPSMNNKQNYQTMQFNLQENKWWDNKAKEGKDSTENEGKCQAIGKFRDVLGVYQYHQDKYIADIMKKQVLRVGKALKTMEEDVLPKQNIKDSNSKPRPKYVSLGLADKWKKFMKDETEARIKKIEEWMKKWAEVFEDIESGKGVGTLGNMFQKRDSDKYTNLCGTADDDEVIDRIKLLLKAYKDRGEWKNPFD